MANIVIIGAGPVGLWTALQIKKRMPAANIDERHSTYQRSHVLRLDYWSLLLYSRKNRNPSEQAFYTEVTGKRVAGVQLGFANSLYIRTNDLESALREYALREGIGIEYRKIRGVCEAEALHPECTVFYRKRRRTQPATPGAARCRRCGALGPAACRGNEIRGRGWSAQT
jgi:hypothetical protein